MNKGSDLIKHPYHTPNNQMIEQLTLLRREMGLVRSYSSTESLAGNKLFLTCKKFLCRLRFESPEHQPIFYKPCP